MTAEPHGGIGRAAPAPASIRPALEMSVAAATPVGMPCRASAPGADAHDPDHAGSPPPSSGVVVSISASMRLPVAAQQAPTAAPPPASPERRLAPRLAAAPPDPPGAAPSAPQPTTTMAAHDESSLDALRRLVDRADFAGRRLALDLGRLDERTGRAERALHDLHDALRLGASLLKALQEEAERAGVPACRPRNATASPRAHGAPNT